jgi:hypothetical protein
VVPSALVKLVSGVHLFEDLLPHQIIEMPLVPVLRRSDESIFLVKGSASRSEVGIHLKKQCSMQLSFMSKTSKVVRYSSHDSIALRLARSNKDLQFVTITAACIWRIATGGLLHWNSGMINVPHSNRHHPILSTLRDMENASADNVDLTTLEIFFDASVFTSVSRGS